MNMKIKRMEKYSKMDIIGVIGQGFVGGALTEGMKHSCRVWTYDKFDESKSDVKDVSGLVEECDVIFVCVPTPMFSNGQCDTSIVESVVKEIDDACKESGFECVVVIKSTVPPGITEYLNDTYENIEVIFNPEFLREASPVEDFKNQNRIVLGGSMDAMSKVAEIYRRAYPGVPVIGLESKAAEMVKYVTNCFLATKVSFANEIFEICQKLDVSYDGVVNAAMFDDRLGKSHWQVPGPDGSLGFGGHCFPKDLSALSFVSKMIGIEPVMLDATWKKNLVVREKSERDWEQMKGRAVV